MAPSSRPSPKQEGVRRESAAHLRLPGNAATDKVLMLVSILAAWWLAGLVFGTRYIGTPIGTFNRFIEIVQLKSTWVDLGWTTYEALYGLLLGTVAAGVA